MKTFAIASCLVFAAAASQLPADDCCAPSMATSATVTKLKTAQAADAEAAQAAFEKIRSLAGEWSQGYVQDGEQKVLKVNYRITGGGSAIVETLHAGDPMEMVSVYFMEDGKLILTHYCAAGNQPRLELASVADGSMVFEFAGGSNIKPDGIYINGLTIRIDGTDNLHHEWTAMMNGAQTEPTVMDFRRVDSVAASASL